MTWTMRPLYLFSCLLALGGVLANSSQAVDPIRPIIDMHLQMDAVYVGETPRVVITIKAPVDRSVSLVKSRYSYSARHLTADLLDATGARVPGGPIQDSRKPPPIEHFALDAGKEFAIDRSLFSHPSSVGRYIVRVKITPTDDMAFCVSKDLPLSVQEIPWKAIRDLVVVHVPSNWTTDPLLDPVEFMNLKTENGYMLMHKCSSLEDVNGVVSVVDVRVQRLLPLREDSKLLAIAFVRQHIKESWVIFDENDKILFARTTTAGELASIYSLNEVAAADETTISRLKIEPPYMEQMLLDFRPQFREIVEFWKKGGPRFVIQCISRLDDNVFTVRDRAEKDLEKVLWLAESRLRALVNQDTSAETKRRIEKLLEKADQQRVEAWKKRNP